MVSSSSHLSHEALSASLERKAFLYYFQFCDLTLFFVALFGSGIRDPGSGMDKNQNPGSGKNIPDTQHWFFKIYFTFFDPTNSLTNKSVLKF